MRTFGIRNLYIEAHWNKESIQSSIPDNILNSWQLPQFQYWTAIRTINMHNWRHFSSNLSDVHWIASSWTMCSLWHHFSRYSVVLNLIFTTYTLLSPTLPNCLPSLQQMEPTPCQVRNRYSQQNQAAHLDRALAFKKAANVDCPSNVSLPMICLRTPYCRYLMSETSLMKQVNDNIQESGADWSENTGQYTESFDIEEDNGDHQQAFRFLGQAPQET
jgi:hypothetical protein